MRNALVAITAFCIGSTLVGCTSNKSNNQPPVQPPKNPAARVDTRTPQHNTEESLGWTLKLQSKCPDTVASTDCLGFYGFAVNKNGTFQIGPGPDGEVRKGTVKEEDLANLETILHSTLTNTNDGGLGLSILSNEEHLTLDGAVSSEDTVSLTRSEGDGQKLLRTSGLDFYYTLKSAEDAQALYKAIKKLAADYYAPLPFPDKCEDGITALQSLTAAVTTCKLDTDCTYLDPNLDTVAASQEAYLETDNCSRVLPLAVGNAELVKASQEKIQESLGQLQQACGEKLMRSDCTQRAGFQLNGTAAVCQQGVCKAPSALTATAGSSTSRF